ncbi:MAG: hypothetical protein QW292_11860 [Candidatus Parvarchaeota archaeon]
MIYSLLHSRDLIRKYYPESVFKHLRRVLKLKIGGDWTISEVPKKSRGRIEGPDILIRNGWS